MLSTGLKKYFADHSEIVEKSIDKFLDDKNRIPKRLNEAMRYSVFNGGKRIRPMLVLLGNAVSNGKIKDALPCAVAVELVHAYSLVHDDLPALDNDDYRRGKLSCHKKFGESTAILVGDALLTKAFEVLSNVSDKNVLVNVLPYLSTRIGNNGMVGGQMLDVESEKKNNLKNKKNVLAYIHEHKTGDLITASIVLGGFSAKAPKNIIKILEEYGENLGLIFQITDDILDVTSTKEVLGKSCTDEKNGKLTYVSLYGLDKSRDKVEELSIRTHKILAGIKSKKVDLLHDLIDYVVGRSF